MDSTDRLFETIADETLEENEEIQSIKIELVDVDVAIATTTIIEDITPDAQEPSNSDEAQESLDTLSNSRTEEVQITNTEHIEAIHQIIANFETEWNVHEGVEQDELTVHPTRLVYRGGLWGVTAEFEISDDDMSWVDEFAPLVVEESSMIDTPESLRSMSVRISLGDDLTPFDYTIYFATDEPHTYWANCETLEDYCEMVAEQNDDVTVEEMLEQDEYQSHTHLMNQREPVNEWFRPFVTGLVDDYLSSSDAVTVNPAQFNTDFEEYTLETVISQEVV